MNFLDMAHSDGWNCLYSLEKETKLVQTSPPIPEPSEKPVEPVPQAETQEPPAQLPENPPDDGMSPSSQRDASSGLSLEYLSGTTLEADEDEISAGMLLEEEDDGSPPGR